MALAGGCMLLASPAWANLEIFFFEITASTSIRYSDMSGTNTSVFRRNTQASVPPFVSFFDEAGRLDDGVAEAFADRPGITQGRQLYAASVQKSTSNAVAAQTTYTGGASVELSATTRWRAIVKNSGTAPEPVDFSFFVSGGGLDAWCASCVAGGLVMSATARISRGVNDEPFNQIWVSRTELNATSPASAALRNGDLPESRDPAGIGFLTASMFHVPDAQDPYFRASIEPFNATLPLFTLAPGQSEDFSYFLEAKIEGSGTALGAAWLVDPFSLGSTDVLLPSSGFALNGVPVAALLVPEPSEWLLMLVGTAVVVTGTRRRAQRQGDSRTRVHSQPVTA
jgi:hypothetical protein